MLSEAALKQHLQNPSHKIATHSNILQEIFPILKKSVQDKKHNLIWHLWDIPSQIL